MTSRLRYFDTHRSHLDSAKYASSSFVCSLLRKGTYDPANDVQRDHVDWDSAVAALRDSSVTPRAHLKLRRASCSADDIKDFGSSAAKLVGRSAFAGRAVYVRLY